MGDFNNLLLHTEHNALIITINRPDKLNALNFETLEELKLVFEDKPFYDDISAIIITGSGNKAFIAGADINEFTQLTSENGTEVSEEGHAVFQLIEDCSLPVIAAVNGYALGGGCELALACHMRIASENAVFGQPEINLGIIPGYGGSQRLTQLVGKGRAIEIITTARNVYAEEAFAIGLLNYLVPLEELMNKCHEIANLLAEKPKIQIAFAIQSINAAFDENGYQTEAAFFGQCMRTRDFKEGVDAFLNKRKPNFTGK